MKKNKVILFIIIFLNLLGFIKDINAQDWGNDDILNPSFANDNRFNNYLDLSGNENTTPVLPDWTQDLILYQMRIDKFGTVPTINSTLHRLYVLERLGITGVVINPIAKSFKGFSWDGSKYWGFYSHTEPNMIDPDLGTDADFTNLINKLHDMGIKVFLDFEFHGVFDREVFIKKMDWVDAYNDAGPENTSSLLTSHPEFFKWVTDEFGFHPRYTDWNTAELIWKKDDGTLNYPLMDWFKNVLVEDWIVKFNLDGLRLDLEPFEVATQVGYSYWEDIKALAKERTGRDIILIPEDGNAERNNAFAFAQEDFGVSNPRFGWDGNVKDFMVTEHLTNYPENNPHHNLTVDPVNIVEVVKGENGNIARNETFYSSAISSHDNAQYTSDGHLVYFGYGTLFQPFIPFWYMGNEFNVRNSTTTYDEFHDRIYYSKINWNDYTANQSHFNAVRKMIYIRKKYKNLIAPSTHRLIDKAMVKIPVIGEQPDLGGYGYFNSTGENVGMIVLGTKETAVNNIKVKLPLAEMRLAGYDEYIFHNLMSDEKVTITPTNEDEFVLDDLLAWDNLIYLIEPSFEDYYKIEIAHSGKCFDIAYGSDQSGTNVWQWDYTESSNQIWKLNDAGNGYFWLEAGNISGKCLEIGGWSTENGGNAIIWDYLNGANQQWRVEDAGDGYYRMINRHSGKSLDIQGASINNEANIWQWDYFDAAHQKFKAVSKTGNGFDPFEAYLPRTGTIDADTDTLFIPEGEVGTAYLSWNASSFSDDEIKVWLKTTSSEQLFSGGATGNNQPAPWISIGEEYKFILWNASGNELEDRIQKLDSVTVVGVAASPSNVEELKNLSFELKDNYPNPFNPITQINYTTVPLSNNQSAEIIVYNSIGQEIWKKSIGMEYSSSADNEITYGTVQFDGSKFNSGVYYYSLVLNKKKIDTKSMLLIK